MTTAQSRQIGWAEWLAIALVIQAAASLLVFGGVLSAILYFFAAVVCWTRLIERVNEHNRAKGKRTISGKGRIAIAATLMVLAGILFPHSGPVSGTRNRVSTSKAHEIACPTEADAALVDFAVAEDDVLRTSPDGGSAAIQTTLSGQKLDLSLETGATVRRLCQTGNWSKVRVLTIPSQFQTSDGWVPSSSLRKVPVTAQGRRIYVADDFEWPAGGKQNRTALLTVLNRIMRDDPACDALDTDSLVANREGNTTVYSIPCWSAGELRSFDFTAADATNGRSFAPIAPITSIDKYDAIEACKQGVLQQASHPSTVEFPTFDYDFRDAGDGSTQVLMSATARNGFNLELEFDIQCDFTGSNLDRVLMSEDRG